MAQNENFGTFRIELEKSVYLPGDIVKVLGKGYVHVVEQQESGAYNYYHEQVYANERKTIFGNIFNTPVIHGCGDDAIFGPPWAPNEGVLLIPLPKERYQVVIRAMNSLYGRQDAVLGEVLIDSREVAGKGTLEVNLTKNGKACEGKVAFSASWVSDVSSVPFLKMNSTASQVPHKILRLQILRATQLRKADIFIKNNVFVQAFSIPADIALSSSGAGFNPPEPVAVAVCEKSIQFGFQLPDDLPTSFVGPECHIVYSIYASMDFQYATDPTARKFFTVVQPLVVASMMVPRSATLTTVALRHLFLPPCCCYGFPVTFLPAHGEVTMYSEIDRSAYAPGEVVQFRIKVDSDIVNATTRLAGSVVGVYLQQVMCRWAGGHTNEDIDTLGDPVEVRPTVGEFSSGTLTIPSVPSTYLGGTGTSEAWSREVGQFGGKWAAATHDPIKWHYELLFRFMMPMPGSCGIRYEAMFESRVPVIIATVGTKTLSALSGLNAWGGAHRASQTISNVRPKEKTMFHSSLSSRHLTMSAPVGQHEHMDRHDHMDRGISRQHVIPMGLPHRDSSAPSSSHIGRVSHLQSTTSHRTTFSRGQSQIIPATLTDAAEADAGTAPEPLEIDGTTPTPVNWMTIPGVKSLFPVLFAQCEPTECMYAGQVIVDEREDRNTNEEDLSVNPWYLVYKP